MYKKGMVVVIICLFIGVNVASSISSNIKQFDIGQKEENINFVESTSGIKMYTFNPTDDAYICESEYDEKFGKNKNIRIRGAYSHEDGDSYQIGLVNFDISSISSDKNISILSATLNLYYYNGGFAPSGRNLNIYNITSDWSEGDVTWNTRPDCADKVTSSATVPNSTGTWMSWEVTNDVLYFFDEPPNNVGWKITDESPVSSQDIPVIYFHSREYDDKNKIPYLEIKTAIADIYVDDDFDPSTPGWGVDHFNKTQDGIDNASDGDTVFVYNGEYYENLLINKSINLIGEHRNVTVVHGEETEKVVNIESDDVTIEGFTFKNGESNTDKTGIDIDQQKNIRISNNTFSGIFCYDINVTFSYKINISHNIFENGRNANIQLLGTENISVEHNFFNNTANDWPHGIRLIISSNDVVSENTFTGSYRKYVYLESSQDNIIIKNVFQPENMTFDKERIDSFINITGSNKNKIFDNILELYIDKPKIDYFIRLKNSNDNQIYGNTLFSYSEIYVSPNKKDNVQGYGIFLSSSNGNFVKNNNISNVKLGIAINQAKGNRLKFNNISSCTQFGLWFGRSTFNLLFNNTLWKNEQTAYFFLAVHDRLWLNDIYPGEETMTIKADWFQGSIIWGQFNYWGNKDLAHWGFKINYMPYVLFSPALRSPREDAVLAKVGWFILSHGEWKEEVVF